jgi:hypothetical protein
MIGLIAAAVFLISGCATTTPSVPVFPEGNVRRLIESYPQEAEKARTVAPAFTRDALKTISRLEEQILFEEALRSLRLKAVSSPKM